MNASPIILRPIFPAFFVLAVMFSSCGGDSAPSTQTNQAPPPQPVEVTEVERRDMRRTLRLVGSLAPEEEAEIRAEQDGLVRQVLFREGQTVAKGDVLVETDDREFTAQIAEATARLNLARSTLERGVIAVEGGGISRQELDQMRAEVARIEAERDLIRVRLDQTKVRAPFDGVAGARRISPGDYLDRDRVVTTVVDVSRLKIDFQVPERFLPRVAVGTRFRVLDMEPGGNGNDPTILAEGEVYFVAPGVDRDTRSAGAKGYIENPPDRLRPGMFASLDLVLETRDQVLAVPEGAILTSQQGSVVIRLKEAGAGPPVAEFVPVKIGLRERGYVEIEAVAEPIAPGTRIVGSGVGGLILFPGVPLEARPMREEFIVGGKEY